FKTFTMKDEERINTYVDIVKKLIRGGRVNKYYPDPAALSNLFDFMKPSRNHGFYNELILNFETGLPNEKNVTKIIVDSDIAPKTVKEDTEEGLKNKVETDANEVNIRRLNRYLYHKALLENPVPCLMNVKLKLRTVDTEEYIAFFNAEIDRFDMTTNMFTRYTLVVGQSNPSWLGRQEVQVINDQLKYTQNFRNLLSKYTTNESEFSFIALNDLEDVRVEEVQRCQIGPLYFKGVRIPEGMEEIFEKHPDAFVLSFPMDRTSVHLSEDKNNDPLVKMYRDVLPPAAQAQRDKKAEELGYKVYKERKFAVTRKALRDFRAFLKKYNARCVVYGV
ncbi:MAG: hypothetical protein ACLFQV_09825, partial [Vulcanimicrobiota bacterium]